MMDKPNQPCESSESYSFTACIKNSISRRIGCRLEWDIWSSKDIPFCTKVDQLLRFEHEYNNVSDNWEQSEIVEHTGCLAPCHYTEYKLAKDPYRSSAASTDILSRTEEKIYPFESFVAEFGGALGLFLGFSFIMVWDGMKSCIQSLWNYFQRTDERNLNLVGPSKTSSS